MPWSLLFSKGGLMLMAVAFVAAAIGLQTLRLDHAKHDLATVRAAIPALKAAVASSEGLRDTEHQQATEALSAAEKACAARVSQAHRSADKIHALVEKPHVSDSKTGCPVRTLLNAGELRDAISPGA